MSAVDRVVIGDDHPAIVEAVARFLDDEDEAEIVGRARDGDQALRLVAQHTLATVATGDVYLDPRLASLCDRHAR